MKLSRRSWFAALCGAGIAVKAKVLSAAQILPAGPKRSEKSPLIEWHEEDYISRWAEVKSVMSGDTYALSDPSLMKIGDVFIVPRPIMDMRPPDLLRAVETYGDYVKLRRIGDNAWPHLSVGAALRYIGNEALGGVEQ
jgi:hypothetical protein